MTLSIAEELADHPELAYRHTVDEYHQMLKKGVLEEGAPFELLDGQIVRKIRNAHGEGLMTIGTLHTAVVSGLVELDARLTRHVCYMRIQSPVTLPPYDEPEPDGVIARGSKTNYLRKHPHAEDILCVIEVADASLRRDRGYKQKVYASSGIWMYVIINLLNRTVEVRTNPLNGQYADIAILKSRQALKLPTADSKAVSVTVRQLIP